MAVAKKMKYPSGVSSKYNVFAVSAYRSFFRVIPGSSLVYELLSKTMIRRVRTYTLEPYKFVERGPERICFSKNLFIFPRIHYTEHESVRWLLQTSPH